MKDTVADLIEYLKTLPPDTKIEVVVSKPFHYEGDIAMFEKLDIGENTYYYENIKTLELGSN